MAQKIAKYRLPNGEEALDTLANGVFTYASPHIDGPSTGSGTGASRAGRGGAVEALAVCLLEQDEGASREKNALFFTNLEKKA
ncbi:MAG: hypothetical protein LBT11_00630 [Treponema sp.]|jgi:hypothetical protein|nr:hypothetical protein [Treponema sp.]